MGLSVRQGSSLHGGYLASLDVPLYPPKKLGAVGVTILLLECDAEK